MVGKTKPATAAEKVRFKKIVALGCLACRIENNPQPLPTEAHHLLSGGRRRGHAYSIPLCLWHHKGETSRGTNPRVMFACHGPSLRLASRAFHETYGTDDELLALANKLIEAQVAA